jgi:trans-aconitate 2-methyltransferase
VASLELAEPVDVVVSNAVLHWVADHERMWRALAAALRPGGRLEVQCGGEGNIAGVRGVIDRVADEAFPELGADRRGSSPLRT